MNTSPGLLIKTWKFAKSLFLAPQAIERIEKMINQLIKNSEDARKRCPNCNSYLKVKVGDEPRPKKGTISLSSALKNKVITYSCECGFEVQKAYSPYSNELPF